MNRLRQWAVTAGRALAGLVVDDGLLAVMALGAIAVAGLLSRESVLGSSDLVGWTLAGLLAVATSVSVRRACRRRRPL